MAVVGARVGTRSRVEWYCSSPCKMRSEKKEVRKKRTLLVKKRKKRKKRKKEKRKQRKVRWIKKRSV